ncbi:hypothetical protein L1987_06484 [Smallanthus sonchifolius]|uniref:Uncharacterized protein n=1 Tax=Smallanthus sonchifolius TaxID=185202 RepID=A0ACB9JYA9_9ASTR|nr:hypothetical protein L1987_06484 [Smallanthus sonchifolius]
MSYMRNGFVTNQPTSYLNLSGIPEGNDQFLASPAFLKMGNPSSSHLLSGDATWNFSSISNDNNNNNQSGYEFRNLMGFGAQTTMHFHGQQFSGGVVATTDGMMAALSSVRSASAGYSDYQKAMNHSDHNYDFQQETSSSNNS